MRDAVIRRSSPWFYFALVFALTWGFWIPAAMASATDSALLTQLLQYAGGLMPLAVTMALTFRRTADLQRDFWSRAVDFRRVGVGWYAVIFLTVPVLTALGALADTILGGRGLELEAAGRFGQQPWMLVPFVLFILAFGPYQKSWPGVVMRLMGYWGSGTP